MPRAAPAFAPSPHHRPLAVHQARTCDLARPHAAEVVHDYAVVTLYLSGTTRLWLGRPLVLRRGDVLLIPEGQPHGPGRPAPSAGSADPTAPGAQWALVCCAACLHGAWGEALRALLQAVRQGGLPVRRLEEDALVEVIALLATLERELARPQPHHGLMVTGLMSQLVAWLQRAGPAAAPAAESGLPPVVSAALSFIDGRATDPISLADVAQQVGRSPAHVATVVKQHTGRTVGAWILSARMAQAREHLRSTDAAVEQIAWQVGFGSPSHFHRAFRRSHGLTPAAWRAAHRGPVP